MSEVNGLHPFVAMELHHVRGMSAAVVVFQAVKGSGLLEKRKEKHQVREWQREVELLEMAIARGEDTEEGDARLKELDDLLAKSPYCIHADTGEVVEKKGYLKHYSKAEVVDINDKIEEWHIKGGEGVSLHEYLGMSVEEYGDWIHTGKLPEHLQSVYRQ